MTDDDFLLRLHGLVVQVLPFRSRDALVDGLINGMPALVDERWPSSTVLHISRVDDRALHTFLTFTKRQLIYLFSDDHIQKHFFFELGPDHLDRLRVLLHVADLHRLVIDHLDEPPRYIRDFQPAETLQTFEDRAGSPTI